MVAGDLYFLRPTDGFASMKPGETRDYDIVVALWAVSRTDFMPNWYVASDDINVEPRTCQSTDMEISYMDDFTEARQWKRVNFDLFNPYTPQERKKKLGYVDTGKVNFLAT